MAKKNKNEGAYNDGTRKRNRLRKLNKHLRKHPNDQDAQSALKKE